MAPRARLTSRAMNIVRRPARDPSRLLEATLGPRVGLKPVYLPNFTLTLLRTPGLPAYYATFLTPLSMNKLDLKSYLQNAYALRCISIRSFVQQQPVREDRPGARMPQPRRFFRPRAIKKMTIEMERPFVWPPAIEDFAPWDKDRFDGAREAQKEQQAEMQRGQEGNPKGLLGAKEKEDRAVLRKQAEKLLKGERRWVGGGGGAARSGGALAVGDLSRDQEGWEEVEAEQKV